MSKLAVFAGISSYALVAGAATADGGCPDADLRPSKTTLPRVEAALVCLMNEERAARDLRPVWVDKRLERSSAFHTNDMVSRGYFAHHKRGRPRLVKRIRRTGYFKGTVSGAYSENLGYGPPERASAHEMHNAFMLSPTHRRNILYRRFRNVGIGSVMIDPDPVFYADYPAAVYTVDFGRRYMHKSKRARCLERTGQSAGAERRSASRPRWLCPARSKG